MTTQAEQDVIDRQREEAAKPPEQPGFMKKLVQALRTGPKTNQDKAYDKALADQDAIDAASGKVRDPKNPTYY